MEPFIIALFTSVVINGIWAAIIGYWVQHKFNVELETHKAKLSQEAAEHNFRFSQVFNKTEETIATVYAKLLTVLNAIDDYVKEMKKRGVNEDEQKKKIQAAMRDLFNYYRPRLIYIPDKTSVKLVDLLDSATELVRTYDTPKSSNRLSKNKLFSLQYFSVA